MIQLSHLVAWSYFKRLLELYLSPFCSITAKEIARFENGSTVWPKLPKKMRLPDLCQKSQEIANLCLLIHFVAKFCRHPKIWETRVVPGLPHPWLVLLRSWGLEEKLDLEDQDLKIKSWRSRLEDLTSKNLWLADLISASVLSKSMVTYPLAFVPANGCIMTFMGVLKRVFLRSGWP